MPNLFWGSIAKCFRYFLPSSSFNVFRWKDSQQLFQSLLRTQNITFTNNMYLFSCLSSFYLRYDILSTKIQKCRLSASMQENEQCSTACIQMFSFIELVLRTCSSVVHSRLNVTVLSSTSLDRVIFSFT